MAGSDDGEAIGKSVEDTEGKILQRHKREWKALRGQLEDKKAHKKVASIPTVRLAARNCSSDP